MATKRSVSFDDAKTNSRTEKIKVTDLISLVKLPEKKWVTGRLYGGLNSYATGWVNYKNKEGKKGKFPVNLRSYDPTTGQFDSTIYDPWFALWQREKDEGVPKEKMTIQINKKFYADFLLRSAQRQQPSTLTKPTRAERESGFKDKDSDTWTPWTVFAMPPTLVEKVKELKGLNLVRSKSSGTKAYSVADAKYGCDVRIYFDDEKSPADKYQIQLGDRTPLSEEELALLRYDTSNLAVEQTDEEVKRDFESFCKRAGIELDEEPKRKRSKRRDEDEDEDDQPKRSKRRSSDDEDEDDAPKRSSKRRDPDDEDDEEDMPKRSKRRADPDDEDEQPKRSSKRRASDEDDEDEDEPPKKRGKKPVEDDDDDLDDEPAPKKRGKAKDDDDDDQDDDDDAPRRGKSKTSTSSSSSAKGRSKRAAEEDEDDGLDDSDEDEEDVKSSKKRRADPDDEDDDEPTPKKRGKFVDPDDEDDDEPAPKRSKKRASEDEDEDDEPAPKRSSKKRPDPDEDDDDEPAPKRGKRKPVRDEDDDDLDD